MHVAGERFGIYRERIKGVSDHASRPVEREPVAMVARRPQDVDGAIRQRVGAWLPGELNHLGPFGHGSQNLALRHAVWKLRGDVLKNIAQSNRVQARTIPA